jgi:Skp family chaperone for outer membrane proteins
MRKHLFVALYATFASVFLSDVTSQAQEPRVGFVDFKRFAAKSVKFQAQHKKLMDLINAKREALERQKKELETEGRMADLRKLERELAAETACSATSSEGSERNLMMLGLQQDLAKIIISRIRVEKGLAIVFNREALLWADEALDLTDEVAKAYDDAEDIPPRPVSGFPREPKRRAP